MPKTVVLVHGVGAPARGETATALARTLGFRRGRQSTLCVDGEPLIEIADEDSRDRLIEVNWADSIHARNTAIGVLRHAWYLITSMLDVAARDTGTGRLVAVRLYRWALLTVTPGAVLFTISTGIGASIDVAWLRPLVLILLVLVAALMTWSLRPLGKHFRWLWLWVALVALVAAAAFRDPLPPSGVLVSLSRPARQFGFAGVMSLLALASAEIWLRWRQKSVQTRLAHLALLYLPFIVLNSAMTWVGVIALSLLSTQPGYEAWEARLTPPFDFARVEAAATIMFAGIGVLGIALPLLGFAIGGRRKHDRTAEPVVNRRGHGARRGLNVFLAVTPLALIGLAAYSIWVSSLSEPPTRTILDTYEMSVWRSLPYLAWLVGPFGLALGVIGDVLFYIQPNDLHPASIRATCRARLRAALRYVGADPGDETVVVAHSQGSVIAADLRALGEMNVPLVTFGSPVSTLYEHFLGVPARGAIGSLPWVNGYREGDYIGGPIRLEGVDNRHWGDGYHTNYWSIPELRDAIADVTTPVR